MPSLPPLDQPDAGTRVIALRSQYPDGLLGVPHGDIRLSWTVESSTADRQLGYQLAWDDTVSDPATGPDSIGVAAPGAAAGATRRYRVRIATEHGWSAWSDDLEVETADLSALPATGVGGDTPGGGPAQLVRTRFELPAAPRRARLRVTSLGVHEVRINGEVIGNEHLAPGWTAYQERILVATWDVTSSLREGENVLAGLLADGWYRGRLGWKGGWEHYGDRLALVAALEVDCEDGARVVVTTGPGWRTATGAIRSASLYDGSELDLALDPAGWDAPGFDDTGWSPATLVPVDLTRLEPRGTTGVRTVAELPMRAERLGERALLDAGQNIAGWVRLVVRGRAGDRVEVRHAEVLEGPGVLHTRSLRSARATDGYVLEHDGETTLEPPFTFHGFRYADVVGAEVVEATAIAVSSAVSPRSSFESSDAALNRLHENVVWSQRDNFVSVPTDCPQRDERLGWTGDAQAFAATASTLFDVEAFWRSWLRDLEIDQTDEAGVPAVVPNILTGPDFDDGHEQDSIMGRAGWADAATIVPWAVYESYGDPMVLAAQLDSMRRWVAHLERRAGDDVVLPSEFQFGDWLDPDAPGDEPWRAKVSADFVANAFYAHSARLLARAERLVGDDARAERTAALGDRVAAATWERWGEEAIGSQSGAAIALQFRICPENDRARVAAGLAALVRADDGRIATGFLGTPLVLPALAEADRFDEAYLMLLRHEAPSWLYQVDMGATTVWERWDAILPDGTIHSGDMTTGEGMLSFNHYAYGAVVDWMYRYVAGIAPVAEWPGYRRIRVAPRPAPGIEWARARVESRLGEVAIDWRLDGDDLRVDLTVPFGATALLDLPVTDRSAVEVEGLASTVRELGPGRHRIRVAAPAVAGARV